MATWAFIGTDQAEQKLGARIGLLASIGNDLPPDRRTLADLSELIGYRIENFASTAQSNAMYIRDEAWSRRIRF